MIPSLSSVTGDIFSSLPPLRFPEGRKIKGQILLFMKRNPENRATTMAEVVPDSVWLLSCGSPGKERVLRANDRVPDRREEAETHRSGLDLFAFTNRPVLGFLVI